MMKLKTIALALTLAVMAPIPAHASEWRDVDGDNLVVMDTAHGRVLFELASQFAPRHAERFRALVRSKFYDGKSFYRVIDGFVAQGGIGEGDDKKLPDWPALMAEFDRNIGIDVDFVALGSPDLFADKVGHVDGFPLLHAHHHAGGPLKFDSFASGITNQGTPCVPFIFILGEGLEAASQIGSLALSIHTDAFEFLGNNLRGLRFGRFQMLVPSPNSEAGCGRRMALYRSNPRTRKLYEYQLAFARSVGGQPTLGALQFLLPNESAFWVAVLSQVSLQPISQLFVRSLLASPKLFRMFGILGIMFAEPGPSASKKGHLRVFTQHQPHEDRTVLEVQPIVGGVFGKEGTPFLRGCLVRSSLAGTHLLRRGP
jgi:hypothetical protein